VATRTFMLAEAIRETNWRNQVTKTIQAWKMGKLANAKISKLVHPCLLRIPHPFSAIWDIRGPFIYPDGNGGGRQAIFLTTSS